MIVRKYRDGSEGHEYEVGDVVRIKDVVGSRGAFGAFFGRAIGSSAPVVRIEPGHPSIALLHVRDSEEWGPSRCFAWMVEPTAETRVTRTVEAED